MARNCHKAVYHGAYLRELKTSYLYPHKDLNLGINGGIFPEDVEKELKEHEDIEAVFITSPTYDGVVSDVKEIAKITHKYEIPLIVDEAHGAHFCFSEYFPVSAAELGADLVIHSLHKTLPSMTQTSLVHLCSNRINRDLLVRFLGIYQTSSPSYILMASMDACMDKLEKEGRQMFEEYTKNLEEARQRLGKLKSIRLLNPKPDPSQGIFDYDRSKILLSTAGTGINGRQLCHILRQEFHLEMEMEAEQYALALTSVGDRKEGFLRLCKAAEEIDSRESLKLTEEWKREEEGDFYPVQAVKISRAMDGDCERIPLEESEGRISCEFAYLYPPGIPLLVPGEEITGLLLRNMRRYQKQGFEIQGLGDMTGETVLVSGEFFDK